MTKCEYGAHYTGTGRYVTCPSKGHAKFIVQRNVDAGIPCEVVRREVGKWEGVRWALRRPLRWQLPPS